MKNVRHMRAMLAVTLLGTLVAESALACKVPATPRSLPDGQSASAEVMLDAKRELDHYLQGVSDYFACEKDGRKLQEVAAQQKIVMASFNEQVRAFNAKARAFKVVNRE